MKVCVVTGCPSPTGSKAYFAFPNRQKCREKHDGWLMFSGRNLMWWEDHKYKSQLAVCEDHFLPKDFMSCDQLSSESANYELRKKLKAGVIPSRHVTEKSNGNLQEGQSEEGRQEEADEAAIKLLQRLEFKNPGRKQIEYGLFNPEESEREKKKLRRFQNSKPRAGVCYKETGMLLDGRDICDCLTETCPGCFYPCPQCSSKKCGPTCRCNRKWVYDYIEDEGRTYRVEFPEQINF